MKFATEWLTMNPALYPHLGHSKVRLGLVGHLGSILVKATSLDTGCPWKVDYREIDPLRGELGQPIAREVIR